jgi:hypothetical protein
MCHRSDRLTTRLIVTYKKPTQLFSSPVFQGKSLYSQKNWTNTDAKQRGLL